MAVSG
jgi:uncharacterized membrane protein YdjX (TVP38/TMEM64 family)